MFKLASNLTLPASAPTDTFVFFGTRGTGKTYGAGRMVEAFHDGGAQVVIVDPVGVWYGLRLAADGRGRGRGLVAAEHEGMAALLGWVVGAVKAEDVPELRGLTT